MRNNIRSKIKKQNGQGMAEYIILVIFIAIVAISVVSLFGTQIRNWFGAATIELAQESSSIQHVTGQEANAAAQKTVKDLQ